MSKPRPLTELQDDLARRIVSAIVADLIDRGRFRQAWFAIGEEGQRELIADWLKLAREEVGGA